MVAGTCFILPAMFIVLAFAWAYARYESTPQDPAWLVVGGGSLGSAYQYLLG
jgi:chromate transport protein ChrA